MKNIVKAVLCFGLFFIMSKGFVTAVSSPVGIDKVIDQKIETVPIVVSPTKSQIKIEKVIDLDNIKPLNTKTPTPIVVTQGVTTTPEPIKPTGTVTQTKPTETEKTTVELEQVETVTVEPTIDEIDKTTEIEEKASSDKLFWIIIIGLLALILAVQVWSTKNNEKKQTKTENE